MAHSTVTTETPKVRINISPVIEREFKCREVFPELRLENAWRVIRSATGVHLLSIERAREVLHDAQAQLSNGILRRGVPVAYDALARNIKEVLSEDDRHGMIDDPGMVGARRQQAAASACFAIGDRVLYFKDGEEYGYKATILDDYQMYSVASDDGPYIDRVGVRRAYRYGYAIKVNGSDHKFFVPAYSLTRDDCKPSHLRLVASNSRGLPRLTS